MADSSPLAGARTWIVVAIALVAIVVGAVISGVNSPRSEMSATEHGGAENVESMGEVPTESEVDEINLGPELLAVLSAEGHKARFAALGEMLMPLSEEEAELFFKLLEGPVPSDMNKRYWHAFFNDAVDRVVRFNLAQREIAGFLGKVALDESQDPVIRDYALQAIPQVVLSRGDSFRHELVDDPKQEELIQVLELAAALNDQAFAGSAMISLQDLSRRGVIDSGRFKEVVIAAVEAGSNSHTRISAIQLAGENGWGEVLPTVRALVEEEETGGSLRLTAIGTLGLLGDEDDLQILQPFLGRSRFDFAATTAVNRISAPIQ